MSTTETDSREKAQELINEFVIRLRRATGYMCKVTVIEEMKQFIKEVTYQEIAEDVANDRQIHIDLLQKKSRRAEVVNARRMFVALCLQRNDKLVSIGNFLKRDHSTIINLRNTHKNIYETDPEYALEYDLLRQTILEKYEGRFITRVQAKADTRPAVSPDFN